MKSIKLYAMLFLLAFYGNAISADHVVKMLNGAPPNMFVFDPPVIKIAVGDSVTWDGDATVSYTHLTLPTICSV